MFYWTVVFCFQAIRALSYEYNVLIRWIRNPELLARVGVWEVMYYRATRVHVNTFPCRLCSCIYEYNMLIRWIRNPEFLARVGAWWHELGQPAHSKTEKINVRRELGQRRYSGTTRTPLYSGQPEHCYRSSSILRWHELGQPAHNGRKTDRKDKTLTAHVTRFVCLMSLCQTC